MVERAVGDERDRRAARPARLRAACSLILPAPTSRIARPVEVAEDLLARARRPPTRRRPGSRRSPSARAPCLPACSAWRKTRSSSGAGRAGLVARRAPGRGSRPRPGRASRARRRRGRGAARPRRRAAGRAPARRRARAARAPRRPPAPRRRRPRRRRRAPCGCRSRGRPPRGRRPRARSASAAPRSRSSATRSRSSTRRVMVRGADEDEAHHEKWAAGSARRTTITSAKPTSAT